MGDSMTTVTAKSPEGPAAGEVSQPLGSPLTANDPRTKNLPKCQCGKQLLRSSYIKVIGGVAPILVDNIKCPDEYGCGFAVFPDGFVDNRRRARNLFAMSELRHGSTLQMGDIP